MCNICDYTHFIIANQTDPFTSDTLLYLVQDCVRWSFQTVETND